VPAHDHEATKFVFHVPDPTAVAAAIRAAGGEVTQEPVVMKNFGNAMIGFAKDPDGYLLELLQAPTRA